MFVIILDVSYMSLRMMRMGSTFIYYTGVLCLVDQRSSVYPKIHCDVLKCAAWRHFRDIMYVRDANAVTK